VSREKIQRRRKIMSENKWDFFVVQQVQQTKGGPSGGYFSRFETVDNDAVPKFTQSASQNGSMFQAKRFTTKVEADNWVQILTFSTADHAA
jgi:hypothetical protein